jgi:hypothetical protein
VTVLGSISECTLQHRGLAEEAVFKKVLKKKNLRPEEKKLLTAIFLALFLYYFWSKVLSFTL